MERVMKLTEQKGGGAEGQRIWCEGLLASEWSYNLQTTSNYHVESHRCVQCGNVLTPSSCRATPALGCTSVTRQIRHTHRGSRR
jgi:hypothetical protein